MLRGTPTGECWPGDWCIPPLAECHARRWTRTVAGLPRLPAETSSSAHRLGHAPFHCTAQRHAAATASRGQQQSLSRTSLHIKPANQGAEEGNARYPAHLPKIEKVTMESEAAHNTNQSSVVDRISVVNSNLFSTVFSYEHSSEKYLSLALSKLGFNQKS